MIARTRRKFTLHGIDLAHDMEIGWRRVHTGTGGAAPTIMDFETGRYRESTVADLYDIARLVDGLASIHWHHRSIVARDATRILDFGHEHHIWLPVGHHKIHCRELLPTMLGPGGAVDAGCGGGGRDRERPYCTAVCCHVVPPMRFATESCDALEAANLAGLILCHTIDPDCRGIFAA